MHRSVEIRQRFESISLATINRPIFSRLSFLRQNKMSYSGEKREKDNRIIQRWTEQHDVIRCETSATLMIRRRWCLA